MKTVKLLKLTLQPTFVIEDEDGCLEEAPTQAFAVKARDVDAVPLKLHEMRSKLEATLNPPQHSVAVAEPGKPGKPGKPEEPKDSEDVSA